MQIRHLPDDTRVYLHKDDQIHHYFVGIPDYNWSLELTTHVDTCEMKEEIIMHLFTIFDEQKCTQIATRVIELIDEY